MISSKTEETFSSQVLPNGELLLGTGSGEVITVGMGDVKKSNPGQNNIYWVDHF